VSTGLDFKARPSLVRSMEFLTRAGPARPFVSCIARSGPARPADAWAQPAAARLLPTRWIYNFKSSAHNQYSYFSGDSWQ